MKHALLFFILILFNFNLSSQVELRLDLFKDGTLKNLNYFKGTSLKNAYIFIEERNIGLHLHEVNLFADGFKVVDQNDQEILNLDLGQHFQGYVNDDEKSIATLSIYKDHLICSFSDKEGNWEVSSSNLKTYLIRKISPTNDDLFNCYTEDVPEKKIEYAPEFGANCKSVGIYFECDYSLYQAKGSVQNVTSYVTSLFNEISKLYLNEQINVSISEIKVWTTIDPYQQYSNIQSVLSKFRTVLNGNFNGNLAHLLTVRSLGGGIAYVDVLCNKANAVGVSMISTSFQNVPTYSWSVEVVTHELGHNLGSWHTHSCNWPGGAIDNCYPTEGGCNPGPPPVNGGTIMSYCHLTNYGINFNNGFGPLPGQRIRDRYNAASCLAGSGSYPSGLVVTNLTSTSARLNWNAVSGITYYQVQYKKNTSSFWNIIDSLTGTSLNLGGLTPNTLYDWKVKTECSGFSPNQQFTTLSSGGNCGLVTGLTISNITTNSAIATWNTVSGASNYILQYRDISQISWQEINGISTSTFTINGLTPNKTYAVRVRPNCNPNFSNEVQFTTIDDGNGGPCDPPKNWQLVSYGSNWVRFNWTPNTGINQYYIAFKTSSMSQWFELGPINWTNVLITGLQPNTTYNFKLRTQCSAYTSVITVTTLNFNDPSDERTESDLNIYPNLTFDDLFVENNVKSNFKIFNSFGQLVQNGYIENSKIDVFNLPSGMYFLNIDDHMIKFFKK